MLCEVLVCSMTDILPPPYYSPDSDSNAAPKSTNDMHQSGKHGVSLKLVKATPKRLETSSSRASGPAPHWVVVNPVASSAPDCGKPGASWRLKKETMRLLGGASIGLWIPTSAILRRIEHGQ